MKKIRVLSVLLLASSALAHSGQHAAGFAAGVVHPLSGLDHLLAMVAVGVLAAPFGRRGLLVPLAFVTAMVLGGLLGIHGVHLPFVEQGVALSVTVLGLLLAFTARLSLPALAAVVGVMGLFHGHAHGTELPPGLSAAEFFAGFTLSTVGLHAAGYGLGRLGARGVWTRRLLGGGVALAGIGLLLG